MENLFSNLSFSLQYALGWMVIHSLWQAVLIALATGVIMLILRKKSAKLRYLVANIALFSLLICAFSTFVYYYQSERKAQLEAFQGLKINPENTAENLSTHNILTVNQTPDPHAAGKIQTVTVSKEGTETRSFGMLSTDIFKEYFNKNIPLIVTLWILGMALFLLKLLSGISYTYVVRSRHNFPVDEYWYDKLQDLKAQLGIQKMVDLVESALVRSPVVVGHLKPVILFPIGIVNRLSPKEVEAILAHELAHIARHDYVFNILQSFIEALFYYHPAVWWLSAQVRNERESACDDVAIALTGDSIHYAKTLVTVQEMAYFPLSASLAFAGQAKKSQFLLRIQRILHQKQNPYVMEKLIATILIIGSLFALAIAQNSVLPSANNNDHTTLSISEDSFVQWGDAPLSMSGFWSAKIIGDEVKVTFNHDMEKGNWTSTRRFKKSEFSALPTSESEFTITRETGTMKFKGKFEENEGYGKFKFEENTGFKSYLAGFDIHNIKEDLMIHLFLSNINKSYMEYLKQSGYTSINKSDLEDLAVHGVNQENLESYIKNFSGLSSTGKISLERIVEFKIHGVDAQYRQSLADAGYIDVALDHILEAKIHGISPEYMKEMSGHKLALHELVEMKIHGVNGDFINKIKKGNSNISPDDIIEAKIHGVDKMDVEKLEKAGVDINNEDLRAFAIHGIDADYIEKMNQAGFGKLTTENILAAKIHGISPEYVKNLSDMGYKNMNFERVLEFKIHGVTSDYVKSIAASGYKDLSPGKLVEFKIHGISPDYVKKVAEMGFKDLSPSRLIELKVHNIGPEFIKGFIDLGYKDTPLSRLIELKVHGVTPSYIKGFQELGFNDISTSKAVETKVHGVTTDYIRQMQAKGYKNLSLDEYIRLKIHGFTNNN